MSFVSRAFGGRRRIPAELAHRVPPGQYVEAEFPVLTAGPTPVIDTNAGEWSFALMAWWPRSASGAGRELSQWFLDSFTEKKLLVFDLGATDVKSVRRAEGGW